MRMPSSFFRLWRIHYIGSQGIVASAFLAIVLLGAPASWAQTFDEAAAAYKRGDCAAAFESFRALAEQGHARAQFVVGGMYALGQCVPQDYNGAVRWYRQAAKQGHAVAQYSLGDMYYKGRGVPQDASEAVRWFRKAAEQGDAEGQVRLGIMYHFGEYGVPQDYAEALRWYRQAAKQGHAVAQYSLGTMYMWGEGVSEDYVQAHKWLNLAASRFSSSNGELRDEAVQLREEVALKMTREQIAEAQRLAREWQLGQ